MIFNRIFLGVVAIGLIFSPLVQARAAEPVDLLVQVNSSANYVEDKRVALLYIEHLLDVTDPNCAASGTLLGYWEDAMSDEMELALLQELAAEARRLGIA